MQPLLGLLNTLLPIVYLLLWIAYFMVFYKESRFAARWSQPLLITTLLLHTLFVVLRTLVLGRMPMGSPLEFCSLLALAILCIYAVIERRVKVSQTGFLVIAFAFLLQFLSSSFTGTVAPYNELLREVPFAVHAILVLFAYTCLSIAFLYALLYLMQARDLSRRKFGLFYRRMPALDVLERMSVGAVKLGVPALFAALVL
jgi:HemX protein